MSDNENVDDQFENGSSDYYESEAIVGRVVNDAGWFFVHSVLLQHPDGSDNIWVNHVQHSRMFPDGRKKITPIGYKLTDKKPSHEDMKEIVSYVLQMRATKQLRQSR